MSIETFPIRDRPVSSAETVLIEERENENTARSRQVYISASGTVLNYLYRDDRIEFQVPIEIQYEMLSHAFHRQMILAGDFFMIEEKRKWKISDFPHLRLTSFIGVVGLADLIQYLVSGNTFFHWFNDILLILSSIGLSIVAVMVETEK